MPVDPPGDPSPETPLTDRPGFAAGGASASVRAPRAAGPQRTPRPAKPAVSSTVVIDPGPPSAVPDDVGPATAPVPLIDEDDRGRRGRRVVTKEPKTVRRGRRVKRVVRRIDLWSVLKLSLVVYTCLYLAVLATLVAVWGLLYSSGSIEKLQSFLEDVGLENFTFYGNQMFRACAAIGAIGVMAGTVITVLATALVNVISELTGGIRLVVIEEDVPQP